ncbi:MAG: ACT domain-containing protein [Gemmatimonadaceae bacterium]|nr:ACT domain-containing protein [Gemmatimonadaceae bacterium]
MSESTPVRDLAPLLRGLHPERHPGVYVFAVVAPGALPSGLTPIATIQEREGTTVIVEESAALAAGLTPRFRAAWITLTVHSALDAVGLTAAIATALGRQRIPCNVVAGTHHDHLFVPLAEAERAMLILAALASQGPPRALVPFAHVADMARSIRFYETIGLRVQNTVAPPDRAGITWAWLAANDASLMLAQATAPIHADQQGVLFYLYVDDVEVEFARLSAAGLAPTEKRAESYAPRGEFRVTDPDGYTVMITHT